MFLSYKQENRKAKSGFALLSMGAGLAKGIAVCGRSVHACSAYVANDYVPSGDAALVA